eukprot:gnl/MRDRNA2_/MRDRNA2_25248_c0_seq1.p1 gnl/MRDRNA2_/MRDRNA2_25248_c0~~gnl/MRDRNA2_/MRDRNA2_25248_c0_seq1.p1  ORF type:complete len:299 (+),score=41.02 gnl/MRDRNA2_/MRDRNA2_25248_c0_seq1:66-962(+)
MEAWASLRSSASPALTRRGSSMPRFSTSQLPSSRPSPSSSRQPLSRSAISARTRLLSPAGSGQRQRLTPASPSVSSQEGQSSRPSSSRAPSTPEKPFGRLLETAIRWGSALRRRRGVQETQRDVQSSAGDEREVQTQPPTPCTPSSECMAASVLQQIASVYPPINPPPGCIWDKATGEAACCPICLADLTPGGQANEPLQRIGCGHVFHHECLCEWFERQWQKRGIVSCPVCRAQVCKACVDDDEEQALDLEYQQYQYQQFEQRQQLEYAGRMLSGHAHVHQHHNPEGLAMANVVPSR